MKITYTQAKSGCGYGRLQIIDWQRGANSKPYDSNEVKAYDKRNTLI